MSGLTPENAFIFRITHIRNIPWMLDNGLHCRNSHLVDPNFISIGNTDLIQARHTREVPIAPGGVLSDYIPFYFTPFSIMMFNIKTGYGGIRHIPNEEIVILCGSLHDLAAMGRPFVFTNQHAYPVTAEYFNDLGELNCIDWQILRKRDFKHNPEDPGKKERYQAEALAYQQLPIADFRGVACHNPTVQAQLQNQVAQRGLQLNIISRPDWYF